MRSAQRVLTKPSAKAAAVHRQIKLAHTVQITNPRKYLPRVWLCCLVVPLIKQKNSDPWACGLPTFLIEVLEKVVLTQLQSSLANHDMPKGFSPALNRVIARRVLHQEFFSI